MLEEKFVELLALVDRQHRKLRSDFDFAHGRAVQALTMAENARRGVHLSSDTAALTRRLLATTSRQIFGVRLEVDQMCSLIDFEAEVAAAIKAQESDGEFEEESGDDRKSFHLFVAN